MNLAMVLPLAIVFACMAVAWFVPTAVRPSLGVRVLTLAVALAAFASVIALVQVTAAGLSEIPAVSDALGWCRALYAGQHGAAPTVASISGVLLTAVAGSTVWRVRRTVVERRLAGRADGVVLIDIDGPVAFAVPGRPGGIVIGRDFLESLDRTERTVVLAHENAHLRHRHHLYVTAVDLCAAGLPFLRPFATRVRFLTERWADESAARRVGSRRVVAETIARIALLPPAGSPAAALGFGGRGVVGRVEALLSPEPAVTPRLAFVASGLLTVILGAAALQTHHLIDFLHHP